jgi:hypothetical protein
MQSLSFLRQPKQQATTSMKFSYSSFWINKCSKRQYIDATTINAALIAYKYKSHSKKPPYDFNVEKLFSLIESNYKFKGLNSEKHREPLLKSLKDYLTRVKLGKSKHLNRDDDLTNLSDARFTKIFEDYIINACIQSNLRTNFNYVDEPPEKLLEYIKQGYSYSWHFKNNYRTGKNFECSDIICLDIDDNKKFNSLDEVIADKFIDNNALIVHPSYSYNFLAGNLKCRVIFRLENTIYNADDFTFLNNGLKNHFKSDPAINIDSCLYGCNRNNDMRNEHSMIEFQPNNILLQVEIDRFIAIGKSLAKTPTVKTAATSQLVKIARQNYATLACPEAPFFEYQNKRLEFIHHHDTIGSQVVGDICASINPSNASVSVLCPYHNDTSPSAWITTTKDGSIFLLKCSAQGCADTGLKM